MQWENRKNQFNSRILKKKFFGFNSIFSESILCETQMEDISVIDVQRINPSHFEMVFSNSDRIKLHSYSRSMCNQSEKLSTINIQVAVNAVWTLRSIAQV